MRWIVAVIICFFGVLGDVRAEDKSLVDEALIQALDSEENAAVILEKIGVSIEVYRDRKWAALREASGDGSISDEEMEALEQKTSDFCEQYFRSIMRACDPSATIWDSSVVTRGDAGMRGVSLGTIRVLVRALCGKAVAAAQDGEGRLAKEYLLTSLNLSDRLASSEHGFFPYILATALYAIAMDGIESVLEHETWDEAQRTEITSRLREIRGGWHAQSVRMIRESNAGIVAEITEMVEAYDAEWREERPDDDDSDIPPLERFDADDFAQRIETVACVWGTGQAEIIIHSLSEIELYGEMIGVYERAHRNYVFIMERFQESIELLTKESGP